MSCILVNIKPLRVKRLMPPIKRLDILLLSHYMGWSFIVGYSSAFCYFKYSL